MGVKLLQFVVLMKACTAWLDEILERKKSLVIYEIYKKY